MFLGSKRFKFKLFKQFKTSSSQNTSLQSKINSRMCAKRGDRLGSLTFIQKRSEKGMVQMMIKMESVVKKYAVNPGFSPTVAVRKRVRRRD